MKDDTTILKQRKRRPGDRYDGYRVRKLDTGFWIIPNIMIRRSESQVFFEEKIYIDKLNQFVRQKRREDIPSLRTLHVFVAAIVRTLAIYPRLNRFVAGKKIYSHNNIRLSLSIKRNMSIDGEETEIMPYFEPTDTLKEVVERFNASLEEARNEFGEGKNATDSFQTLLSKIPTFLKSFVVFVAKNLDKIGLMPKWIYRASPFHSSAFITDVGSLGIDSVFHHLYDVGTTTCFVAIGKKHKEQYIDEDGQVSTRQYITVRVTVDERVTDGFYCASAIKNFVRLIKNPERLEEKPESLPDDM